MTHPFPISFTSTGGRAIKQIKLCLKDSRKELFMCRMLQNTKGHVVPLQSRTIGIIQTKFILLTGSSTRLMVTTWDNLSSKKSETLESF